MGVQSGTIWEDFKFHVLHGNTLVKIIFVNIGVFILIKLSGLIGFIVGDGGLMSTVLPWLMLPSELIEIAKKPWTILTSMFLHIGFRHILWNMVLLFSMGRIIALLLRPRIILPIYLFGGIAGAILQTTVINFIPNFSGFNLPSLGASAAVMAVLVAAPTLSPNYKVNILFIGDIRIKYIALVFVLIDILNIPQGMYVGHIAHLGGALMGYVFIKQFQRGNDWSIPFYKAWDGVGNFFSKLFKNIKPIKFKKEPKVAYKNVKYTKRMSPSARSKQVDKQNKMDVILDKISSSGYDSLTKEEKEFLFHSSQDN